MNVISTIKRVSKKTHSCNACLFLFESDYRSLGATISEYRQIIEAEKKRGKILPGEVYEEVSYVEGRLFGRYRQKPEIHVICQKHDLYFE